jgi:hypothetical protein
MTIDQAARPARRGRGSRAMNGGGLLVNWGCYDLDYLKIANK